MHPEAFPVVLLCSLTPTQTPPGYLLPQNAAFPQECSASEGFSLPQSQHVFHTFNGPTFEATYDLPTQ